MSNLKQYMADVDYKNNDTENIFYSIEEVLANRKEKVNKYVLQIELDSYGRLSILNTFNYYTDLN